MKSAYPSSYSFFDATSDSIRAEDVDRCRSSSSFSSLADLFTNPKSKSDLFTNVRAPVFVPEEVRFPAKKKRECEERTSIWHEWGSGECQTENVAQESSGLSSDLSKCSGPESSELFSISSSSSLKSMGSAYVSLLAEEFSFPARKKREDGSSWREERTSLQDWSMGSKDNVRTENSAPVGSMTDMCPSKSSSKSFDLLSSSKSSLLSHPGAHAGGISDDLPFPATKRDEKKFWQECNMDGVPSDCRKVATARRCTSGVSSLADMYMRKPGGKCSGLFSETTASNTDEVVFPKRKIRADRNAWRDWMNTGYDDSEDDTHQEMLEADNSIPCSATGATQSSEDLALSHLAPFFNEDSIQRPEEFSMPVSLPGTDLMLASPVHQTGGESPDSLQSWGPTNLRVASEADSSLRGGRMGNADQLASPKSSVDAEVRRFSHLPTLHKEVERTMDGGEFSNANRQIQMEEADDDVEMTSRFRSAKSGQRSSRQNGKYPPPLGSLSKPGSLRVPHHMPWVQLQPIRSNGRFMLQEVKVTQPVVFQPIRREGRLVLQLIGQDSGLHNVEKTKRFHGDCPVAEAKADLLLENKMDVMDTEEKRVAEKTDVRQPKENPVFTGNERKRRTSSTVLPASEILQKLEDAEKSGAEAGNGTSNRKSINSPEWCARTVETISTSDRKVSEPDRAFTLEAGFQDKPPPWLLSKAPPEERRFDARRLLHSDVGFRERFPLSTPEAPERLGKMGSSITLPKTRETGALRAQLQTLSRTHSLRNGLSGFSGTRVEGEGSLTRSRSRRNTAPTESAKEERSSSCSVRGRAPDAKPSLSVYQGIIRDTVLSLTTAHSFLRSLRMRPDLPGEPDPRFINYTSLGGAAFSCADVMGKRHHEKNFWEQQPCVSSCVS